MSDRIQTTADPKSKTANPLGRLLERYPVLWILILGGLGVSAIAVVVTRTTENLVEAVALEAAELYSQAIEEFRTVYSAEVVAPLRQQGFEVSHDYRGKEHTIPLPATLSMILGRRIGEHEAGAETQLYSAYPFPWRAEASEKIFEEAFSRDAWEFLTANPEKPFYRFEEIGGRRVLRYAKADRMRQSCVDCHNTHPESPRTGWKVGDVRGVLQVDLPLASSPVAAARAAMRSVIVLIALLGMAVLVGTWSLVGRIRRSEAKLERAALTDNAQVMIAYVDRDQRHKFGNKIYRDWFGDATGGIEGRTIREVLGEEDYEVIRPNIEQALLGQGVSFEAKMPFPGEGIRDLFVTYTPDFSADGAVRGVSIGATDTTRVKQLEQYLDGVLMNLPVGVAILEGPEFRYFRINQALAKLNGFSVREHLGRSLAEVLPDAAEELIPVLQLVLETGEPVLGREFSLQLPGDTGKPRQLIDYLFPITGPDGKPKAVGAVVVDVSERMELEERLMRSQKLESLGTLAGGIAHDFNNILTTIMGHTDLLRDSIGDNDDLTGVERAARHAADLTRGLLALSRQQPREVRVVDLNAALSRMEKLLRRVIESHVELVVLPSDAACNIQIDPGQLEQVLLNLALNSRDAMSDGGKLTMGVQKITRDGKEEAVVSVIDTGVGMSGDQCAKMFDPFFTTKEVGKGTGLGLSMCYGVVTGSGGHFEVESAPGKGTTIKIHFPLVEAGERITPPARPSAVAAGTETILLVEDETAVRNLGARVLRNSGYTVIEAGDGEEALSVLAERGGSIDAMVTDMMMPRMGGKALIERMRDDYPDIKILCTTGYAEKEAMRSQTIAELPSLLKPYVSSALLGKVRDVLDGRRQPPRFSPSIPA